MSSVMPSGNSGFLRRIARHIAGRLAVLAVVTSSAMATDYSQFAQQRDGSWLRNGLNQYERLSVHESLSQEEGDGALVARSYVCAIVDLERYLVLRADLLAHAVGEGRKKHHPNAERLEGMAAAIPLIVPLVQTRFSAEGAPCDRVVVMVRAYLDKYPEVLTKDAAVIIEKALLDAYSGNDSP